MNAVRFVSVGNDTYGITGIPSTVAGRGIMRRAGLADGTKGFTQVRAAKMHKTLRSCFGGCVSVLELSN